MKEKIKRFYEKHKGEIKVCAGIFAGAFVGISYKVCLEKGYELGRNQGTIIGVATVNMAANQALSEDPNMKLKDFSPAMYMETILKVFEKKGSE